MIQILRRSSLGLGSGRRSASKLERHRHFYRLLPVFRQVDAVAHVVFTGETWPGHRPFELVVTLPPEAVVNVTAALDA